MTLDIDFKGVEYVGGEDVRQGKAGHAVNFRFRVTSHVRDSFSYELVVPGILALDEPVYRKAYEALKELGAELAADAEAHLKHFDQTARRGR